VSLENLYREVILDHYRSPRNREPLTVVDAHAEGVNPLCGDEVVVDMKIEDGRVTGVSVRGQGCSISQSSGSMMSEAIKGLNRDEIADLTDRFRRLLSLENEDIDHEHSEDHGLGDLEALQGVRKYPVRIKCAYLPWTTLEQALGA
jgi:nitrogen fixation NifU-like protein